MRKFKLHFEIRGRFKRLRIDKQLSNGFIFGKTLGFRNIVSIHAQIGLHYTGKSF
jgi:hypothetical protein